MGKFFITSLLFIPFTSLANEDTTSKSIQELKKMCDHKDSHELRQKCYAHYYKRQKQADKIAEAFTKNKPS